MSATSGILSMPEDTFQATSIPEPDGIEPPTIENGSLVENPLGNGSTTVSKDMSTASVTSVVPDPLTASEVFQNEALNTDFPELIVTTAAPDANASIGTTKGAVSERGRARGRGRGAKALVDSSPSGSITVLTTIAPTPTKLETLSQSSAPRGRGRGGRPRGSRGTRVVRGTRGSTRGSARGGKRKRSKDDDEEDDDAGNETSGSENFTPQQHSRSGRRITQPAPAIPVIKLEHVSPPPSDIPAFLAPALVTPAAKPTSPNTSSKKRSKLHITTPAPTANSIAPTIAHRRRPPGAAAVCTYCGRGASPSSNLIVFCDGCNKPWHQLCHNPPLRAAMAQIEASEWFCADCAGLRRDKSALEGCVAATGLGLTYVERRKRLMGCGKERLVSLLMVVGGIYPDLPLFPPEGVEAGADAVGMEVGMMNGRNGAVANNPPPQILNAIAPSPAMASAIPQEPPLLPEPEEEAHVTYYESEPLPYPKAGNGIQLLPESYASLLDDNIGAEGVFSHMRWTDSGNGEWVSKSELVASVG